ncbi:intradiol ring-cleavage dioxygenase [Flagellimonas pacifica]|uniref:Protocatechuate 3,4-dioxygenase beta subunit n=1 Tax=Flagellimonas pacifica TaxID=1247520 RepID=A0A285MUY6_9FLAO|nr:intradiol ring-cleavage dioxygenase [Allomuricauda parva]SNZ00995.1 Protocatechuate 3,4-dioxygenase beta subunit [Allomuricauda parva]
MERKKFIQKLGIGVVTPILTTSFMSCDKGDDIENMTPNTCSPSPSETAGPFPIKSPTERVRENIIGNRAGIPLVINFTIQNSNNNCNPLEGVFVDIWQCDSKGNYSEYSDQLDGNFTNEHFLRGRQTTDAKGQVTFTSIYPGWYPGRAPHLHLEIKRGNASLLVTQVAFPENVSKIVYATSNYKGDFDTANTNDGEFRDSLSQNLADSVTGDTANGYTLKKVITVAG